MPRCSRLSPPDASGPTSYTSPSNRALKSLRCMGLSPIVERWKASAASSMGELWLQVPTRRSVPTVFALWKQRGVLSDEVLDPALQEPVMLAARRERQPSRLIARAPKLSTIRSHRGSTVLLSWVFIPNSCSMANSKISQSGPRPIANSYGKLECPSADASGSAVRKLGNGGAFSPSQTSLLPVGRS